MKELLEPFSHSLSKLMKGQASERHKTKPTKEEWMKNWISEKKVIFLRR